MSPLNTEAFWIYATVWLWLVRVLQNLLIAIFYIKLHFPKKEKPEKIVARVIFYFEYISHNKT